jgi:hypothetical protein
VQDGFMRKDQQLKFNMSNMQVSLIIENGLRNQRFEKSNAVAAKTKFESDLQKIKLQKRKTSGITEIYYQTLRKLC